MATLLRMISAVICAIVLIGFLAFATDEVERGSTAQIESIDGTSPGERKREKKSGPVREVVDDANDVLLAPFDDVTDSRNPWVQRLVPTALALLIYGLGLLLVANYLPKPRRVKQDWRTA